MNMFDENSDDTGWTSSITKCIVRTCIAYLLKIKNR